MVTAPTVDQRPSHLKLKSLILKKHDNDSNLNTLSFRNTNWMSRWTVFKIAKILPNQRTHLIPQVGGMLNFLKYALCKSFGPLICPLDWWVCVFFVCESLNSGRNSSPFNMTCYDVLFHKRRVSVTLRCDGNLIIVEKIMSRRSRISSRVSGIFFCFQVG